MQHLNQQLLFLLIFLGMSFASWLFGRLKEQAQIRKARDEARRRYEEQLRTGRPVAAEASTPAQPAEPTLTERRQEQIRELRRQQQEKQQQARREQERPVVVQTSGTAAPARAPVQRSAKRPGTPGNVVVIRDSRGGQARPQPQRPAPTQLQKPTQLAKPGGRRTAPADLNEQMRQQRQREQTERESLTRIVAEQARVKDESARRRREESAQRAAATPEVVYSTEPKRTVQRNTLFRELFGSSGGSGGKSGLARALIAAEVLGKPVSLRDGPVI